MTKEGRTQEAAASNTKAAQKREEQDRKGIVELEKERDRLAEKILQNHLKEMTTLQRQVALKKEIAEHEKNADLAMRIGNERLSIDEKLKAEGLRGQLRTDHKLENIDYKSSISHGGYAGGVGSLRSAGMDHAAQTARATTDTFKAIESLIPMLKGYILDPNNDRRRHTIEATGGVHFS